MGLRKEMQGGILELVLEWSRKKIQVLGTFGFEKETQDVISRELLKLLTDV